MKQLILFRHGDAVRNSDSDFNRELSEIGISSVIKSACILTKSGLTIDKILTSSSKRTMQTVEIIQRISEYHGKVEANDKLYHAKENVIFDFIFQTDDKIDTLLIVGHNPGLQNFCDNYSHGAPLFLETSGLCVLKFDTEKWSLFPSAGYNRILFF